MNENINLCEILKDCPRETPLYSPMYSEVYFSHIDGDSDDGIVYVYKHKLSKGNTRCIHSQDKGIISFYSNGTTGNPDFNVTDECMLYPSKNQRDWGKWKCPKPKKPKFDPKTLKAFDKVLIFNYADKCWICDFYSHIIEEYDENSEYQYICIGDTSDKIIPYNDDTKHLVGISDEVPEYYKYWED